MKVSFKDFLQIVNNTKNTRSYCDYTTSNSSEYSIDALIRLMISPVVTKHPRMHNLHEEICGNGIQYKTLVINKDDNGREKVVYKHGRCFWETVDGFITGIPSLDRPLSGEEAFKYAGYIGSSENTVLYNRYTSKLLKPGKSEMSELGMLFMKAASKGDTSGASYTQSIAFKDIYTTRSNKSLRELQSASFIGSISRMSDEKHSYFATSKNADLQVRTSDNKSGYCMADFYVVIDIDNGAQINKIIKAFSKLPECLIPQIIIEEIGYEGTKKGNASAIIAFDTPLTSENRLKIVKAMKMYLACQANVFAIDGKCTGFNLFKNPLKLNDKKLQRRTRIHKTPSIHSAAEAIRMADAYINKFDNLYNDEAESFIINNGLKYTTSSYSQLLKKFAKWQKANAKREQIKKLNDPTEDDDILHIGERNNTLVRELSSMLLQEYNRIGFVEAFKDLQTPERVLKALWPVLQSSMDNSDGEYTWKRCYSIINWAYERDRRIYKGDSENARLDFYIKVSKQRKYMMKDNKCQLMWAYGLECKSEKDLARLPELDGIYIRKLSSTRAQILHGAETNMLKGIAYLFASYEGNLPRVATTLRRYAKIHNLDLTNYQHLSRINIAARTILYNECNERFTSSKADELANYLCLYVSACQHSRNLEKCYVEPERRISNQREDRTGFFRLTRSSHLLYDSVKYSKAIKQMLEMFINYNRDDGEYVPITYKQISRTSCINRIFAECWHNHHIDWSSCAMALTYVHKKALENVNMYVNISCLHNFWVNTTIDYAANLYISTKIYADCPKPVTKIADKIAPGMFTTEIVDYASEHGFVIDDDLGYSCNGRFKTVGELLTHVLHLGSVVTQSNYFDKAVENRVNCILKCIRDTKETAPEKERNRIYNYSIPIINRLFTLIMKAFKPEIRLGIETNIQVDRLYTDSFYNNKISFNKSKMNEIAVIA